MANAATVVLMLVWPCGVFSAGAQAGATGAPWTGPATYDIHVRGSLEKVISEVRAVTGSHLTSAFPEPPTEAEIVLDMEDATLSELLLELCGQAGLVFDVTSATGHIMLRPGDISVDPRPCADVGDFSIRVDGVGLESRRSLALRWGDPEPLREERRQLAIDLSITPAAPELVDLLAGLSPKIAAVTDSGETLAPQTGADGEAAPGMVPIPLAPGKGCTIALAAPEGPAGFIERLEGRLLRYAEVKSTLVTLQPGALGANVAGGDVTGSVRTWHLLDGMLTVTVNLKYPPLVSEPAADVVTAALVLEDGTTRHDGVISLRGSAAEGGLEATIRYRFGEAAPAEVDHLDLTLIRRGPPGPETPFVIEHIPLPPEG